MPINTTITPIIENDRHFIEVSLNGEPPVRYGPFCDAAEAEIMAIRMGAFCRSLFNQPVVMRQPSKRRA